MDEVRYCYKCGHALIDGAEYCAFCGIKVIGTIDRVEASAKYEPCVEEDSNIENKAIWETSAQKPLSTEAQSIKEIRPSDIPLSANDTKREKIYLNIPKSQGGGTFSCYAASRYGSFVGEKKKIWFENEKGERLSEEYESGGIDEIHSNTISCIWLGGGLGMRRFLLRYADECFAYFREGPISGLQYATKASDFIERNEQYEYRFSNEPLSESGFYKIDDRIVSIDSLDEYSFSSQKVFKGISPIVCILVGALLGVAGFAVVPLVLCDLFRIEISSSLLTVLGVIGAIVGVIYLLVVNHSDYVVNITFELQSSGNLINRNNRTPLPFNTSKEEQVAPNDSTFEKAYIYVQNMAIHLQHQEKPFESLNLEEKLAVLDRYFSDHLIADSRINLIVSVVIADREYWKKSDCLNMNDLGDLVMRVFTWINNSSTPA